MQLWSGKEGEVLTCMGGVARSGYVVAYGRDGLVEICVPEAEQGETLEDARAWAAERRDRKHRESQKRLTARKKSE